MVPRSCRRAFLTVVLASLGAACGGSDDASISAPVVPPSAPWNGAGAPPTDAPAGPTGGTTTPAPPAGPVAAAACVGLLAGGALVELDLDKETTAPLGNLPDAQGMTSSIGVRGREVFFCAQGRVARFELDTKKLEVATGTTCAAVTADATGVLVLDEERNRVLEFADWASVLTRKPARALAAPDGNAIGVGPSGILVAELAAREIVVMNRTTGDQDTFRPRGLETMVQGITELGNERLVTSGLFAQGSGVVAFDRNTGVLTRKLFERQDVSALTCSR